MYVYILRTHKRKITNYQIMLLRFDEEFVYLFDDVLERVCRNEIPKRKFYIMLRNHSLIFLKTTLNMSHLGHRSLLQEMRHYI